MTAVFVEDGPDKGAIWHFGEPNKEQRALLEGTAWADLSHLAVVAVTGEDRLKWLHDLTTHRRVFYPLSLKDKVFKTERQFPPHGGVKNRKRFVSVRGGG